MSSDYNEADEGVLTPVSDVSDVSSFEDEDMELTDPAIMEAQEDLPDDMQAVERKFDVLAEVDAETLNEAEIEDYDYRLRVVNFQWRILNGDYVCDLEARKYRQGQRVMRNPWTKLT